MKTRKRQEEDSRGEVKGGGRYGGGAGRGRRPESGTMPTHPPIDPITLVPEGVGGSGHPPPLFLKEVKGLPPPHPNTYFCRGGGTGSALTLVPEGVGRGVGG